jgi:uncharacterized membrane protein
VARRSRGEEAVFLQVSGADLSLEGMLLAGMVIGALGVLDDVTVSQASTVRPCAGRIRRFVSASWSGARCGWLNLEVVAKEVVATLVGSIGLIAAVPVTTALAALLALGEQPERLAATEHGHPH